MTFFKDFVFVVADHVNVKSCDIQLKIVFSSKWSNLHF